jgi:hypothetical protein
MQEKQRWGVVSASLPIEDLEAVNGHRAMADDEVVAATAAGRFGLSGESRPPGLGQGAAAQYDCRDEPGSDGYDVATPDA